MLKIEEKKITITQRTAYSYCDCCNIEIGHSEEHDDGYYEEFGEISSNIITKCRYHCHSKELKGHLCCKCTEEFLKALDESISKLARDFKIKVDNE